MFKVSPTYLPGIAFVQLSRLPVVQFEYLNKHIPKIDRFRVEINNEKLEDCISYEAYEQWYELINPQYYENYLESQI